MIFPKLGQVRIEQLRDELYSVLGPFPSKAIQWNQVDAIEIEDVDGKATQYQTELQAIIDAHVPTMVYFDDEVRAVNTADVHARFLLSQLANKTPQEIHTLMQARMDAWTSLGDARDDLREWLPLLAAIIAWKVM